MKAEQNQHVSVRRLPDGVIFTALLYAFDNNILRLTLPAHTGVPVEAGELIEVKCQATIYLGEAGLIHGQDLSVNVEHALDRAALESIQQVWYVPAEE